MRRLGVLSLVLALSACGRNEPPEAVSVGGGSGGFGSGGSSGTGTGGGGPNLLEVAAILDGRVLRQPCLADVSPRVCRTQAPGACPANADPLLDGARPTDESLSFGGEPGTLYDVTLRVQGLVEGKTYLRSTDVSSDPGHGFSRGGVPEHDKNQASVFAISVASPPAVYYLNSLGVEGLRHSVHRVDYEATMTISGQSPLRVTVSDPNCHALKNCREPDVPGECLPETLPNLEPKIAEALGVAPAAESGQFLGLTVKSVAIRP